MTACSDVPATLAVYLVDGDHLVRAGLRSLIESTEGGRVVGEHDNARAAIAEIAEVVPDVVMLEVALPELSGLDAIRLVKQASPRSRVVMVAQQVAAHSVQHALDAGADGFVAKRSEPEELGEALRAVTRGERHLCPIAAETLTVAVRDGRPPRSRVDRLTPREREVFLMLAVGKTNKEVASALHVSLSTVKKHRENLQRKLDCHSSAELARLAVREGLTTL